MHTPKDDFENLTFNPFDLQYILLNNINDPDDNFFNTNQFSDKNYFTIEETKSKLSCCDNKSFSILHLNIRSFKKNFDKLVNFLATLSFNFKVICVAEMWCSSEHSNRDLYKLSNYSSIHQTRSSGKPGGGLAIFVHNSLTYSVRKDLSTNNEDIESFCIETINTKSKNILINTSYRQPAGRYSEFEIYLKQFLYKPKNKKSYLVGDLNRNLLGHKTNTKVKDYLYLTFKNFLIPLINKPTRMTKTNATLIHHIATNNFLNTYSSTGIAKSGISDHFPIFLITSAQYLDNIQNKATIRKRELNETSRQYFTEILNEVNWKHLYSLTDTNLAYEYFLRTFSGLYNHAFPIKEVSVKFKKMSSILG